MVRIGRRAELRKNTEPEEGGGWYSSQKVVTICHFFIENSLRQCMKPKKFSRSARIIHKRSVRAARPEYADDVLESRTGGYEDLPEVVRGRELVPRKL